MVGTLLPSEGKGENSASLAQESNDAYQPIVDKPIIKPSVPFQRSFMSWCYRLFIREPLGYEAETTVLRDSDGLWRQFLPFLVSDFLKVPLRAFLITYGFDGFDLTRSEITYPDRDKPEPLKGWQFDKWLLVASFFGLPTRPEAFEDGGKITPKLTFKQLMKNFIGGWTPLYHYNEQKQRVWDLNEKGIWRLVVALILKIFVILPLKILAIPIKTLINIVKLFSEFLPMILIPCVRMLVNLALLIAFGIPTLISGGWLLLCLIYFEKIAVEYESS